MRIVNASGKRKSAIARAVARPGSGILRVNSVRIESFVPLLARQKIMEPLILAGDMSKKIDIDVIVRGGGTIGQADAARLAIGKLLVAYSEDPLLRDIFLNYDRSLLVADPRRKETRKPGPSTARTSAQKSKR
jgi:small subunit ribosomal protein S9